MMKTIKKMMSKKALMGLGVMLLVCVTVAFAAVNVKGLIVDALTGFTVAGAAPTGHSLCGNGTVYVDCSTSPTPPQVCNSNGCYITYSDGTIIQWGTAAGCGSGGACATAVTFPIAFTTTANLSVVSSISHGNSSWNANAVGKSTTGFTMSYGPLVYVGGSGVNFDGSELADWRAIGH